MYSVALKEALGITDLCPGLPDFVYKMRVLGYPPGYRLAAEEQVRLQQLSMYDEHGHGDTDRVRIMLIYQSHVVLFFQSLFLMKTLRLRMRRSFHVRTLCVIMLISLKF